MNHKRRGVALILVLWLVILLTGLGAQVVSASRSSTGVASTVRSRIAARYAAESGVMLGVATVRDTLEKMGNSRDRQTYLNSLEQNSSRAPENSIGDQRFMTVFVDVNRRLDVNNASQSQLTKLFSYFTDASTAARAATAIREYVDPPAGVFATLPNRADIQFPPIPVARPLRSLEMLKGISAFPQRLAMQVAPYLTVDGDGRINRMTASDTVLSVAAGSLVDEPTRILVVSRGWLKGEPLTHEIQATYAIEQNSLVLVRWQERDL